MDRQRLCQRSHGCLGDRGFLVENDISGHEAKTITGRVPLRVIYLSPFRLENRGVRHLLNIESITHAGIEGVEVLLLGPEITCQRAFA
jgi:hypothetical protein